MQGIEGGKRPSKARVAANPALSETARETRRVQNAHIPKPPVKHGLGPARGNAPAAQRQMRVNVVADQEKQRLALNGRVLRDALLREDPSVKALLSRTTIQQGDELHVVPGTHAILGATLKSLVNRGGLAGARAYIHLASLGFPMGEIGGSSAEQNAQRYAKKLYDETGHILSAEVPNVSVLNAKDRSTINQKLKDRGVANPEKMSEPQALKTLRETPSGWIDRAAQDALNSTKSLTGLPIAALKISAGQGAALGALATGDTARAKRYEAGVLGTSGGLAEGIKNTYQPWIEHPVGRLEQAAKHGEVASTLGAFLPAKTILGGGAGAAARAGLAGEAAKTFATMDRPTLALPKTAMGFTEDAAGKRVSIPGTEQKLLWNQRRPYSRNLIDRVVQHQTDKLIASSKTLSDRKVKTQAANIHAGERGAAYQERGALSHPVLKAGRKLSRMDAKAAVAFMQKTTPEQLAAYYQILGVPKEAEYWQRVASKNPGSVPNERVQAWIDAADTAIKGREGILASLPSGVALPPEAAAARSNLVHNEVTRILREAGHPLADAAPANPAVYFPHVSEEPLSHGGFLMKRGQNLVPRLAAETGQANNLVRFRSGEWSKNLRHAEMKIARAPLLHHEIKHMVTQVDVHGRAVPAGTKYDPATTIELPVAEHGDLLNLKPTQVAGEAERLVSKRLAELRAQMGEHAGAKELLDNLFATVKEKRGGKPGETGSAAILMPKAVWEESTGRVLHQFSKPSKNLRALKAVTDVWKYWTLYLRGGWLTHNIGGNTLQTVVGGTGPVSLTRAAMPKYRKLIEESVPGVNNAGVWTDTARMHHLGDFENTRAGVALRNAQESPVGHAISEGTAGSVIPYANRIPGVRAVPVSPVSAVKGIANTFSAGNVAFENWMRRANFLHSAIPAAKTAAGGRFTTTAATAMDLLRQGDTEAAARAIHEGMQHMHDYMGRTDRPIKDVSRVTVPFMRWYKFVIPFVLFHLPVRAPIRTALLQQAGQWGLQGQGSLPDSLQGAIPGGTSQQDTQYGPMPGETEPHTVGGLITSQPWNSLASPFQLTGSDPRQVLQHIGGNVASPFLPPVAEAVWGQDPQTNREIYVKDTDPTTGKTVSMPLSKASYGTKLRYFLHQLVYSIPQAALVSPQSYGSGADATHPYWASQPQQDTFQRILNYVTGVNYKPHDYTLDELRAVYNGMEPFARDGAGTPAEVDMARKIRDALHVRLGQANSPAAQRLQAWKIKDAELFAQQGIHAKPLKPEKPAKPPKPLKP